MRDKVLNFINDFTKGNRIIIDTFLNGYCYYFSVILLERFGGELYYLPIDNHFIVRIDKVFYDVTGIFDVGGKISYRWCDFVQEEPLEAARIIKDCIYI